jgi:hypothetical protein
LLNRSILTSSQKIKFTLKKGEPFMKKMRFKDKANNLIDISNWVFRAQFIKNYDEDSILSTLTLTNSGIVADNSKSEIIFTVSADDTSSLIATDHGKFLIQYSPDLTNWLTLVQGYWNVDASSFVDFEEPTDPPVEEEPTGD